MKRYILNIYQPEGPPPGDVDVQQMMRDLDALNDEMKSAGAWVFTGSLHPASSATVVRLEDDEVLITDGPYAEGTEHIGGLWIINAPDLDAAIEWGRKATRTLGLPIEVRPFQGDI
jgi:hypothetical protein